jgi:hypothetical protein
VGQFEKLSHFTSRGTDKMPNNFVSKAFKQSCRPISILLLEEFRMSTESQTHTDNGVEKVITQSQETTGEKRPERIGGWLIFVAIGLVISLLQNVTYFLGSIALITRKSIWERLTDPKSVAYHPAWKGLLIFDAVTSSLILFATIALLWFFFRKRRIFPKLAAVLIPLIFFTGLAGYFLSGVIPAVAENRVCETGISSNCKICWGTYLDSLFSAVEESSENVCALIQDQSSCPCGKAV